MKKVLCLVLILCMLTAFFSITATATDFKLYDFSENIDVQFLCDLDGTERKVNTTITPRNLTEKESYSTNSR